MGTPERHAQVCYVDGCDAVVRSVGMCNKHYLRWRRLGSTDDSALTNLVHLRPEDRLLERLVQTPTGCWVWTGAINENGYGVMQVDGSARRVHRLAYEWFVGEIPDGLVVDHLCRERRCANPDHLELVDTAENSRRGQLARAQCRNGHIYTPENTIWRKVRVCRSCVVSSKYQSKVRRRRS